MSDQEELGPGEAAVEPAEPTSQSSDKPFAAAGSDGNNQGALMSALDAARVDAKPLREDQVKNAVAFLTNPKVVASTAGAKRSFLLSKGLTDEEIDAAVERTKSVSPALPSQPPVQTVPTTPAAPPSPSATTTVADQSSSAVVAQSAAAQASWMRMSAAVVLVSFAAVGVGTVAIPYIKRGWKWFTSSPEDDKKDSDSMKELLVLMSKQIEQQQQLSQQVQDVVSTVKGMQEQRQGSESGAGTSRQQSGAQIEALRNEVSALNAAVAKTAPFAQDISDIKSMLRQQSPPGSQASAGMHPAAANTRYGSRMPAPQNPSSAHSSPRPMYAAPAPHQSAALPSGTVPMSNPGYPRNGGASNGNSAPAHNISASYYTPEAGSYWQTSANGTQGAVVAEAAPRYASVASTVDSVGGSAPRQSVMTGGSDSEPPHPPEFYNVLDMVTKGMTPPGVRSDIVDKPTEPDLQPTPPTMSRRPKPWDQTGSSRTPDLTGAIRAAVTGTPNFLDRPLGGDSPDAGSVGGGLDAAGKMSNQDVSSLDQGSSNRDHAFDTTGDGHGQRDALQVAGTAQ